MCYTRKVSWKGLDFIISDCFGVGFEWDDEKFIEAIKNKDERIWEILDWVAMGEVEKYDQAASFESVMVSNIHDDIYSIYRYLCNLDESGELDEIASNKYLKNSRARKYINNYYNGKLRKDVEEDRQHKKGQKSNQVKIKGYVYLILLENGLYKIGKAKELKSRLKPFSVSFPMKWNLIHNFKSDDYSYSEKYLHEKFKNKRDVGEFFRLDDEDVLYIQSIGDGQL